jgi:hypothetical protein
MTRKRTVVLYEKEGTSVDRVVLATSDPTVVSAVESAVGRQVGAAVRPRRARRRRDGSANCEGAK